MVPEREEGKKGGVKCGRFTTLTPPYYWPTKLLIRAHLPLPDVSDDGCPGVGVLADLAGDRVLQEGLGNGTLEALVHLPHHQVSLTVHLCPLLIFRLLLLCTADSLGKLLQNGVCLGVVGGFAGDLELVQTLQKNLC